MNINTINSLTPVPNAMPNFQGMQPNFGTNMPNVRPDMPMPMPQGPQANPAAQGVSLYVGNLDPEVNEQRLYEHFVQYGHIINTKVMRDSYNGESRGFGFVTFANINDALRAKSLLNYTKILDREIRIALKRNPSELNQNANLFFKNLDPTITSKKLEEECSKFGSIISCVVKIDDENNKPLGYGYVQFETAQNAEECQQQMNNMMLGEKNISVNTFLPKNKRQNPFAKSNLYVKCFPPQWSDAEIEKFIADNFGLYGTISSSGTFEDKHINKKYAFVAFEKQEDAQNALSELNEHEIQGHDEKLYVAYAQDKATRRRTLKSKHMKFKNETNLYIKSLKPDVDEARVAAAFGKYGKVTSVCLKTHEPKGAAAGQNGQQTGTLPPMEKPAVRLRFGFVNFATADETKNAFTDCKKDPQVLALIDQSINTRGTEFIYYAQTKTVRQQYLRMQKKNLKTYKIIHDNVIQYYQLMKYFMPQGFRNNQNGRPQRPNNNNQRGGRGGSQFRSRGGPYQSGRNNFHHGGQGNDRHHGNSHHNHHGHGQNQFSNVTPAPNNVTPGPSGQTQGPYFGNQNLNQGGAQFGNGVDMANMNNMGNFGGMMNNQAPTMPMNQGSNMPNMPVAGMGGNMGANTTRDLAWLKNNIAEFEKMENLERKNILGNLMYPLVEKSVSNPEHVPKITGMLIDLEVLKVTEIVEIMENADFLKDRIDEAIGIINETE